MRITLYRGRCFHQQRTRIQAIQRFVNTLMHVRAPFSGRYAELHTPFGVPLRGTHGTPGGSSSQGAENTEPIRNGVGRGVDGVTNCPIIAQQTFTVGTPALEYFRIRA